MLILLLRDYLTEKGFDCREKLSNTNPVIQFVVLLIAFSVLTVLAVYGGDALSANFIYASH